MSPLRGCRGFSNHFQGLMALATRLGPYRGRKLGSESVVTKATES